MISVDFTHISQPFFLFWVQKWDKEHSDIPRFAPFTAAGYFVAHSDFLREGK
jgi:hypothetical protein